MVSASWAPNRGPELNDGELVLLQLAADDGPPPLVPQDGSQPLHKYVLGLRGHFLP
jgi:hypothetical protein